MKRTFSTELAYVFGIVFVALGVVLMEKADFGVSMVVAPAYLLYRWLSPVWSNWCEFKRHCGVEFGAYAQRQYDYAREYTKIFFKEYREAFGRDYV